MFDGQTAITQRGLRGRERCNYVGDSRFMPGRPRTTRPRSSPTPGPKREFLALAPWVTPDAPRATLRATQAKLAPGSGDRLENDYVETAIAADLPFPPDPWRRNCISSPDAAMAHGHGWSAWHR